jgi:hypothetical protein
LPCGGDHENFFLKSLCSFALPRDYTVKSKKYPEKELFKSHHHKLVSLLQKSIKN